jgi:Caspase domain
LYSSDVVTSQIEHYAVVVGIDQYAQLSSCNFAVQSAIAFAEWLRQPDGGGLSAENIYTLVSPAELPATPLDVKPRGSDIDDVLAQLVQGKKEKVGERLYFYFAGQASGSLHSDVLLLMADAALDRPGGGISLRRYRQLLSHCFAEIVFVLDCAFIPYNNSLASEPGLAAPVEMRRSSVKEFILMSTTKGTHDTVDLGAASIGLLTKVVLEGLRGGAASGSGPAVNDQELPERQITAVSLSDYVRARVRDTTTGPKLQQLPEMLLPNERISFSTVTVSLLTGKVVIEVPHWTAEVRICNNLMQLVAGPLELKKRNKKTVKNGDLYAAEVRLAEGIYRVDVNLEDHKESQFVVVQFNQTITIENESWKELSFVSAAPLEGTASTHEWHMGPAIEWSRKITWPNSPGGDKRTSTLYLFVRTSEPQKYPRFADGLRLLDAGGNLITDFSDGIVKDKDAGWLAFRADLQPGYYILRRGRAGVRLRHQPLYLCHNWETHIFFQALSRPSMRSQAVNMARRGSGFQANDDNAIAAEAVLDAIRYSSNIKRLVTQENLSALLHDKIENPWLGVLAAYALRTELDESPNPETQALLDHVISFLDQIGEHPDVRALKLDSSKPAPQPFLYPPLLIKGLRLVEKHSFKFRGTVPEGSLTDLVLDGLLINSPWTAWRELPEAPRTTDVTQTTADALPAADYVVADSAVGAAAAALQLTSAKAPTLCVADVVMPGRKKRASSSNRKYRVSSVSVNSFQDAQLLGVVQNLTNTADLDTLPDVVTFNENKQATDLLDIINPTAISQAAGISLAHTEGSLQRLRNLVSGSLGGSYSLKWQDELSPAEKLTLEYALAESAHSSGADANEGVVVPHPSITIEDCVTTIRGEASRLLIPPEDNTPADTDVQAAKKIADRLLAVATTLLDRAAFTVTTDARHKIAFCNRAFVSLLASVDMSLSEKEREAQKKNNHQLWEKALKKLPLGGSALTNPVAGSTPKEFRVRRTLIKEEGTDKSKAYLNTLKGKDSVSVSSTILEQVSEILPDLTRQASFFWYDSNERAAYTSKLEHLTTQLETTIGVTTT